MVTAAIRNTKRANDNSIQFCIRILERLPQSIAVVVSIQCVRMSRHHVLPATIMAVPLRLGALGKHPAGRHRPYAAAGLNGGSVRRQRDSRAVTSTGKGMGGSAESFGIHLI